MLISASCSRLGCTCLTHCHICIDSTHTWACLHCEEMLCIPLVGCVSGVSNSLEHLQHWPCVWTPFLLEHCTGRGCWMAAMNVTCTLSVMLLNTSRTGCVQRIMQVQGYLPYMRTLRLEDCSFCECCKSACSCWCCGSLAAAGLMPLVYRSALLA